MAEDQQQEQPLAAIDEAAALRDDGEAVMDDEGLAGGVMRLRVLSPDGEEIWLDGISVRYYVHEVHGFMCLFGVGERNKWS